MNEVGYVTKSIKSMKIFKHAGSSIADFPTGLDTVSYALFKSLNCYDWSHSLRMKL